MTRPMPPLSLFDDDCRDTFASAPEIIDWATATFIESGAEQYAIRLDRYQEVSSPAASTS